jgi:hypothetical protein
MDNIQHLVSKSIMRVIFYILNLSFTFFIRIRPPQSLYKFYTYLSGYPLQNLANMSILASSSG